MLALALTGAMLGLSLYHRSCITIKETDDIPKEMVKSYNLAFDFNYNIDDENYYCEYGIKTDYGLRLRIKCRKLGNINHFKGYKETLEKIYQGYVYIEDCKCSPYIYVDVERENI